VEVRFLICPKVGAALAAWLLTVGVGASAEREVRCRPLDLEVWRLEPRPSQYAGFCADEPAACTLSGDPVLEWSATRAELEAVNRAVNAETEFVPDEEEGGLGDCWRLPAGYGGDCEDFALEKRRRLVSAGQPSAALTMAIVHHEVQFFPHAVLLAETSAGTWVLDNLSDALLCWDAVPYRYERRERPDGLWERYVVE
jgi:predicted transglutaminase-like cysteine proteinase